MLAIDCFPIHVIVIGNDQRKNPTKIPARQNKYKDVEITQPLYFLGVLYN